MVTTSTYGHDTSELITMSVGDSDGVVAACAES
jgi:hypothetical protein